MSSPAQTSAVTAAMRQVVATRYVLPLREGGSLPGLMEADDLGTYVVKFRGAGQGAKALVAEVIAARLAQALQLSVPELVVVELDPLLGRAEPDQEVQELLLASPGLNLGVDYLPRSLGFDPAADTVAPGLAASVVWFDALIHNVDRSWRNPNLLCWHGDLWMIDHGASLYFAHNWSSRAAAATRPYGQIDEHVLLPAAAPVTAVDEDLAARLTPQVLAAAAAAVPDAWLVDDPEFASPAAVRAAYLEVLTTRLAQRELWVPPLEAARARL